MPPSNCKEEKDGGYYINISNKYYGVYLHRL